MNFSIIIPNYNGAEFLPSCLTSILNAIKQTPKNNYEIILVDNGSTDNSVPIVKKFSIPDTKYIILDTNLGFAYAVNQGILSAKHLWVVPCNNDIKLSPNWFEIMSQTIRDYPNIPAFFGTVKNYDGSKIESTGLKFYLRGKCLNIRKKITRPKLIWGGNASLIIYNKKIIQKIGLLDPHFFAYEEDVDLAFRLNSSGYHTLLVPQAISYHLGGGTSRKMGYLRQMMDAKNWWLIILKNYSLKTIFFNFFPILEERLRNLSGLTKAVIHTDGLKSIYTLPKALFKTYSGIFIKYDHWN